MPTAPEMVAPQGERSGFCAHLC